MYASEAIVIEDYSQRIKQAWIQHSLNSVKTCVSLTFSVSVPLLVANFSWNNFNKYQLLAACEFNFYSL